MRTYFEWVQYGPGKQFTKADRSTVTHNFASWFAWTVQGLANYYKVTGDEPAKTLSGKLAHTVNIGRCPFRNGDFYDGVLDEVALFNVALADDDILNIADREYQDMFWQSTSTVKQSQP